ncbi:FtsZ-interacting cell division protein YlmF [Sporomusaceae bacterium BoRhaA]|uniref:cell division protein SepF n=1 Tax=Pelorhabdus rhamnosifermentans TaxID=2772457 RepID=UPI001C06229D|nr:cell division protein SepF [Pelorhabdus rhamnosifermentans]MBU2703428.1 FtsZ-interacting cell division protein YlmF [Pelorhabdus rhamnosifermentans]
MVSSFFEQVMNYIISPADENENQLCVHHNATMKLLVISLNSLDQACRYADLLRSGVTLIVEYSAVDKQSQQTLNDFLNGVCYILQGSTQALGTDVMMYMPENVEAHRHISASTQPIRSSYPFERIVPAQRFS